MHYDYTHAQTLNNKKKLTQSQQETPFLKTKAGKKNSKNKFIYEFRNHYSPRFNFHGTDEKS